MIPPLNIVVEPFWGCKYKCVSCPTGRGELEQTYDVLEARVLKLILGIVEKQAPINRIGLFNWGDPLLHPMLHELVEVAKPYARTYVSSAGHVVRCDLEALVRSRPDKLIIATSGWTDAVYQTTHAGGSVSTFKKLLADLSALRAENVFVCFHRYSNNLHEESAVREFVRSFGFGFNANWAYNAPVEALIREESHPFQVVTTKEQLRVSNAEKGYVCGLQTSELMIHKNGDVRGCSAAMDQTIIGNICNDSIQELLERKKSYHLCTACYAKGVYKICCGSSVHVDKRCAEVVGKNGLKYWVERQRKKIWRNFELRKVK